MVMLEAWKTLQVFTDMDTAIYFFITIIFAPWIKDKKESWAWGYFSDGSFPMRPREEKKRFSVTNFRSNLLAISLIEAECFWVGGWTSVIEFLQRWKGSLQLKARWEEKWSVQWLPAFPWWSSSFCKGFEDLRWGRQECWDSSYKNSACAII